MAIKISGSTIIDDSRKVINASHVGIGTTNPTVELDVDGDAKISGVITSTKYVVEGGSSSGFLKADGSIDSTPYGVGSGNLESISVKDDGQNVGSSSTFVGLDFYNGIGVSTTSTVGIASITLEDNISISGIFTASGGYNIGVQSGGTDVTTGVITALNFIGSGNTFSYNTSSKTVDISIASGGISSIFEDTSPTLGGDLDLNSNDITGIGSIFITGSSKIGIGTDNPLQKVQVGSANSLGISTDGKIFTITSDGSVGIGTTNPTSKLDVDGTLNVSGVSTFLGDVNIGTGGTTAFFDVSSGKVGIGTAILTNGAKLSLPTLTGFDGDALFSAGNQLSDYSLWVLNDSANADPSLRQKYVRQFTFNDYTISVGSTKAFRVSNPTNFDSNIISGPGGAPDTDVAFIVNPNTSTELRYNYSKKFATTTDGFEVVNGTSETAVISGPQNIIVDPSPDDVVAIVEGDISAAGVSTITGIITTNIAVGNLIQEVDGVISTGTTVTSVGASQVGISKTSLGSATNQEFTFANQTPTGIVRIKGDLYVDGTTTEINSTTLTIDDLNVVVASGATNGLTADTAGLTVDGANAYLKYNYNAGTNETWELNKNVGIGTDNAETKLDVRGDVLLPNGSATLNFGPDIPNADLVIGHNGQFPNSGYISNISGDLDYTSQKHIFSDENEQWKYLELSDDETALYGANTKKLSVSSTGVSITDDVSIGTGATVAFFDVSSGNIGIASTQPTAKLDVDGTLSVSGVSTFQDKVGIGITISPRVNLSLPTKSNFSFNNGLIGAGSVGEYDLTVVDNANQQYVRQYTLNNYTVSVGSTQAFRISNASGSTTAPAAPAGMLDSQVAFVVNPNTSTELRYNYDKKLETTGYGVSITGDLNVSGISTFSGGIEVSGVATATSFSGDGASLINVDATTAYSADLSTLATITDNVSGKLTYTEFDQISQVDQPAGTPVTTGASTDYDFHAMQSYLSKDGKTLFSVRMNNDTAGSSVVTIYEKNQSGFNYVGFLTETTYATVGAAQTVTYWGPIVTSSADGSIFAIGSPDGFDDFNAREKYWFSQEVTGGTGASTGSQQSVHIYQRTGSNIESLGIITAGQYGLNSVDRGHPLDSDGADGFGLSMAFSNDGSKLYIGAPDYFRTPDPYDTTASDFVRGRVYAFDKSGSSYNFVGIITQTRDSTNNDDGNKFGISIACSSDGNKLYIGDSHSGFGTSGNPTFSSSEREGVVYAYDRSGSNFSCVGIISTGLFPVGTSVTVYGSSQFGFDVACSDDGNTIVIGSPRMEKADVSGSTDAGGAIHVVSRSGNSFSVSGRHIHTAADGGNLGFINQRYFGRTIACNSDATKILTSKWTNTSQSLSAYGEVWAYSRSGSDLNNVGILTSPRETSDPAMVFAATETYGSSLSIDSTGDTIGIGAPGHIVPGETLNDAGAVFLFSASRQIALHGNQITNNIGIGTANTNPTSTLDVDGTLSVSGLSTFSDDLTVGTATTGVVARTDGTLNVSGISTFHNNVHLGDDDRIIFGEGNDLKIWHNGNDSYIQDAGTGSLILSTDSLEVKHSGLNSTLLTATNGGAVDLYHNNSKKFETTGYGVSVTGGANVSGVSTFLGNVNIGTAAAANVPGLYLKGVSDETNFFQYPSISIGGTTTSKYYDIFVVDDPDVQFVRHFSNGFDINMSVADARQFVVSNTNGFSGLVDPGVPDTDIAFKIVPNASTELRYNKVKKLETTANGIAVSGIVTAVSGVVTYYGDGSQLTGTGSGASSPWITTGYTGIGTTSAVGIGTKIEIHPYDTQNSGTLSFEGSAGQLFSISNNLTSGSIFSVNDVSGIPSIDVNADGTIQLAPLSSTEFVGIGTTNPTEKLHVVGDARITGILTIGTSSITLNGANDNITIGTGVTITGSTGIISATGLYVGGTEVTGGGGGGGISSVSEDTSPQLGGTLQTNGNLIDFGDSSSTTDDRLRFGAGQDLQIFHNGANSYISQSSNVGDLYLTSLNDDNDIIIQTDDAHGNTTDYFRADGSTGESILYHYGTAKLSTKSTGIDVSGTITGADSVASSANGFRKITASTSTPSGGSDGDIWIKYTA